MSLLDDLVRTISGVHSQVSRGGGQPPGYLYLWEQLKPWLTNLSANATRKWLPQAGSSICEMYHHESGQIVGPCEHASVDRCVICHRHVCLSHTFVDSNCDAVCYRCVGSLSNRQHTPPPAPVDPKVKTAWALGTLGLNETATWDEVGVAYKKLLVKLHPDKPDGDEQLYKKVREAYDFLKKVYGKT